MTSIFDPKPYFDPMYQYTKHEFAPKPQVKKGTELQDQLESYMTSRGQAKVTEKQLPTIFKDSLHKPQESLARPLLTSLIEVRKRDGLKLNVSVDGLRKDSNLRRNQLVLENVLRMREKETWLLEASIKLHDM